MVRPSWSSAEQCYWEVETDDIEASLNEKEPVVDMTATGKLWTSGPRQQVTSEGRCGWTVDEDKKHVGADFQEPSVGMIGTMYTSAMAADGCWMHRCVEVIQI
jgi:hypothetical protein